MFCPKCRDEYRPGFTRCATCDVDLVDDLSAAPSPAPQPSMAIATGPVPMLEYCGFLELDEAREAREQLRGAGIRSDIVIRDNPEASAGGPPEEYWLRIERARYAEGAKRLDLVAPQEPAGADEAFDCGECGRPVAASETACPHCGARFEDEG